MYRFALLKAFAFPCPPPKTAAASAASWASRFPMPLPKQQQHQQHHGPSGSRCRPQSKSISSINAASKTATASAASWASRFPMPLPKQQQHQQHHGPAGSRCRLPNNSSISSIMGLPVPEAASQTTAGVSAASWAPVSCQALKHELLNAESPSSKTSPCLIAACACCSCWAVAACSSSQDCWLPGGLVYDSLNSAGQEQRSCLVITECDPLNTQDS